MQKRLYLILILLFSSSAIFAQEKNQLIKSGELIQKAIGLHDEGKYKEAIDLYRQVPRSDTNYIWALYELSISYTADSQFTQALKVCEEGLRSDPEREREPELYNQYANLVDDGGNPEKALLIYDSAISKYPSFSSLYLNKGTTQLKLERYEEAEKTLRQALLIDPYSVSSHYMLGLAAINQGKIVPAFISFFSYLVFAPSGKYANKSINLLSTISKNKDELAPLLQNRKSGPGEEYQLLEQIILSKIALDKQYKPIIKLDDPISRQIQVLLEKVEYNESSQDFWMQYYVPLYKKIFEEKEFETFINYIFSGVQLEAIQTYVKKNKKELESLANEIVAYFNGIRTTRELNFSKRDNTAMKYLFEDGKLSGKGASENGGEKLTGAWEFYYPAGNARSKGSFNNNGEREGAWIYYNFNGKLRAKENYKNGKLEGHCEFYHPNGNKSSEMTYSNDLLNGTKNTWYLSGAAREREQYKNDKLEGEKLSYYSNGNLHTREHYVADTLDGLYESYFQNGQLEIRATYKNGLLSSQAKGFYPNGITESEGEYVNNKREGAWKRYFDNGQLKSAEHYVNGLLDGEYSEYYRNGKLFTRSIYKKGKINGEINYYDDDGKLFSVFVYENDKLKSARYYDKAGKLISSSDAKSKKLELTSYRPDGTKKSVSPYNENGDEDGLETYYFHSGKISETSEYVKGQLQGTSKGYHQNGKPSAFVSYEQGAKNGYYQSWFIHGTLQSEGWYVADLAEGNWNFYNELGDLVSKTNYYNDEEQGYKEEFWPNGKKQSETLYQYGWISKLFQFDTTGRLMHSVDLSSGTGKFSMLHLNGKKYIEANYVKGSFDGPYIFYFFDGKPETIVYYKRGLPDSAYRDYFYGGQLHIEGQYHLGDKAGTWKYYSENGKLFLTEEYKNGKLNGKRTFYYENGKPDVESEMLDDNKHGWLRKFDPEGNLLYQLRYEDNLPFGYSYLGKSGAPVPEIPLPAATGKVETYYADGSKSASFSYQDGKLIGPDLLYFRNGKPMSESNEDYSNSEGPSREYYSNGQLKEERNYLHDNLHGPYKKYNEKGICTEDGNYYNGSYHGKIHYYDDAGKLKATYLYYYGKLLSVEK